jgi:DNA-binding transcriptional MerR regulator
MRRLKFAESEKVKNLKSLLSIKEFSGMCGVEQSTLRYWDEIGLFSPAQRNAENGYRYYTPEQAIQVNFIKVLSNLEVPLKAIAEISENRTPETLIQLMEAQEAVLDGEFHRLNNMYSTIRILRNFFREGLSVEKPEEISLQMLCDFPIILGPANSPWDGLHFYEGFTNYCNFANKHRVNLNNPVGGYYESFEYYMEWPSVPTCFFSVDPRGKDSRPAGKYLVAYIQGSYGQMENTPQRLADYAQEQGFALKGPIYIVYLLSEICETDPSRYLAKVCAAVESKTVGKPH